MSQGHVQRSIEEINRLGREVGGPGGGRSLSTTRPHYRTWSMSLVERLTFMKCYAENVCNITDAKKGVHKLYSDREQMTRSMCNHLKGTNTRLARLVDRVESLKEKVLSTALPDEHFEDLGDNVMVRATRFTPVRSYEIVPVLWNEAENRAVERSECPVCQDHFTEVFAQAASTGASWLYPTVSTRQLLRLLHQTGRVPDLSRGHRVV